MTHLELNYFSKGPISKYSHMSHSEALEVQVSTSPCLVRLLGLRLWLSFLTTVRVASLGQGPHVEQFLWHQLCLIISVRPQTLQSSVK